MLIDMHCHASETPGVRRQNGTTYPRPHELVAALDVAGIDKAVLLASVSPECKYDLVTPTAVAAICQYYPDRLIPFCNVDPRMLTHSIEADFRPMLSWFKENGFRGAGEYTPNIPFDDPLNMNLFAQMEEVGLPLLFHMASTLGRGGQYGCYDEIGLPRLEKVLAAFPKLIFVGHSQVFWSEIAANVTEADRHGYPSGKVVPGRLVSLLREYSNLHAELSAGSGYNALTRDVEFGYRFLEEFQDRLYFGTDIAYCPQALPIVDYFKKLKAERPIAPEAYEKIAWKNAARLLELDL